jgi:DNA invertase Pin-like site-specific DNA recombinase
MKVYGYARVSTGRQVGGISLLEQQRRIEGYVQAAGWQLDEMFIESGRSAWTPLAERAEGRRL